MIDRLIDIVCDVSDAIEEFVGAICVPLAVP